MKIENKILLTLDIVVPLFVTLMVITLLLGWLVAAGCFFLALFICFSVEAWYSRTLLKRREHWNGTIDEE